MEYKPPKNIQDTKEEATLKAYAMKSEFFQINTVTEICSRYLSDDILSDFAITKVFDFLVKFIQYAPV